LTSAQSLRKSPASRNNQSRRKRLGWRGRLVFLAFLSILGLFGLGVAARLLAPSSNTSLTRFDAIIVLGTPADNDGNPTPVQLANVTEGVREYERGVASRLILTGGAAHNRFVEAQVMARTAEAQGIPKSAIFLESKAKNTIENACYATQIMKAHGWRSAEVVSNVYHLPRTGMILNNLPIEWRTHAAPPLAPETAVSAKTMVVRETLKTVRYLIWTRWTKRCEP
jgi:uncharacterized SAM-binding protein YcdF (DUF218 family)